MGKAGELWVEVGAKTAKFTRAMGSVEGKLKTLGTKMKSVGSTMSKRLTLPIIAMGAASVKAFADFDKAMTESLAIMGPISDSMQKKMEDVAKTISEETTFSAKELAEAYYFLASAGMDAKQSISALDKVARFAQAGAFDLATATDLLTDAQTALGLSSKDVAVNEKNLVAISDTLVKANTLANASVQQFSEALTNRAAPSMRTLGIEMEEGVAVLAAFADAGVKGQKAGLRFSMLMTNLTTVAEKNKEAFDNLGVSLYDVEGNLNNMADIIGDLEQALKGMSAEQKMATLTQLGFNERAKQSILVLLGMSEKIRDYEDALKDAGGVTDEVANKQMEAFSNQLKVVRNMLVNVGAELGEVLIPVLRKLIEGYIKPAIEWFKDLSDKQKELIVKIGALVAALGPLMAILGNLLGIVGKLSKAIKFLTTSPIGLLISALALITERTIAAINTFKSFKTSLEGYLTASGKKMSAFEKTWHSVTAAINKHVYGVNYAKRATKEYAEMTAEARKEQAKAAETTWEAIKKTGMHEKAVKSLESAFGWLIPKVKESTDDEKDFTKAIDVGTKSLEKANKAILDLAENTRVYGPIVREMGETFADTARDMSGVLDNAVGEMEDRVPDVTDKVEEETEETKSLWDEMADGLQTKWASTIGDVLSGATSMKEGLKGIWDSMKQQFFDIIGQMLAKWATDFVGGIISGAMEGGQSIIENIGGVLSDIGGTVKELGGSAASILSGGLSDVISGAISGLISGLVGGGADMDATNRELHNIWEENRNQLNTLGNIMGGVDTLKNIGWKTKSLLANIKSNTDTGGGGGGNIGNLNVTNGILMDIKKTLAQIRAWAKRIRNVLKRIGGFAEGGIAWKPQMAMVAEKEPEVIIPLSKLKNETTAEASSAKNINIKMKPILIPWEDMGGWMINFIEEKSDDESIKINPRSVR